MILKKTIDNVGAGPVSARNKNYLGEPMNQITFPLLNLQLNISPIAFQILGINIYWYAIILVSAFIIAMLIFKLRDGKYGINYSDILDLAIYVIPISIISARLYYVLFNLEYYILNPNQILNFRTGGLAIYGGIIGGAITCFIFRKKRKINILDLLDFIVPALALRTSNRKMGKFCKYRSIWSSSKFTLENGYLRGRKIHRSTPNLSL